MKAGTRSREIKRRQFITPMLFLIGRGRPHLSTVNCQLSTDIFSLTNSQLAAIAILNHL
ncbi:MAG: hypothetical protein JGK01_21500 [Microcoleus sp. PH2017_03_ELD_O_A]|nr:hypothetical protein [Microcoleus sp. PH2017_04_SCI_O_A]MCC3444232.1 hypothetical protein [Microcoleus sp. PH2017_03_ELD_O_A]MCC3512090.1 hypothetical protein [Microcoleus sp. PH2017_17_BER_D_A]